MVHVWEVLEERVHDSQIHILSTSAASPGRWSEATSHRPQSTAWSPLYEGHAVLLVSWMDNLLTNRLDRLENNVGKKQAFCAWRKTLRSLSSAHDKWEQKAKCLKFLFSEDMKMWKIFSLLIDKSWHRVINVLTWFVPSQMSYELEPTCSWILISW